MTPRGLARRFGLRVEVADLGVWDPAVLCSEYDPHGAVARVNERMLRKLAAPERERIMDFAVAHELYHHLRGSRGGRLRHAEEHAATYFAERLTSTKVACMIRSLRVSCSAQPDGEEIRSGER